MISCVSHRKMRKRPLRKANHRRKMPQFSELFSGTQRATLPARTPRRTPLNRSRAGRSKDGSSNYLASQSDRRIMKLELELGSKIRQVEFTLDQERVRSSIDGRVVEADAVEVSPGTYSILIDGKSFEARVESSATGLRVQVNGREYQFAIRDARHCRRYRGAAAEAEGNSQKVLMAPMPGKVIRLLVKAGDAVAGAARDFWLSRR